MVRKNYWLYFRNPKSMILILILPVIQCLTILFCQSLSYQWTNLSIPEPDILPVGPVPHCYGREDCVTIGYSIIGEST